MIFAGIVKNEEVCAKGNILFECDTFDGVALKEGVLYYLNTEVTISGVFYRKGYYFYDGTKPVYFRESDSSKYKIGTIVKSPLPLNDNQLHLFDGELLSDELYNDFYAYVAASESLAPECFTTESLWQQSVTDYGMCGKFVLDTENKTVRLPKLNISRQIYLESAFDSNLVPTIKEFEYIVVK